MRARSLARESRVRDDPATGSMDAGLAEVRERGVSRAAKSYLDETCSLRAIARTSSAFRERQCARSINEMRCLA